MTYRDEDEGLRARVETLEEELADARSTIARLQGENAVNEVANDKPNPFLGAPTRLMLERELPFEITDEGYEAIAELLRTRIPHRGEIAQVGRTLTYSMRGHELVRVTRVGKGKTRVKVHGDHRGHGVLLGVGAFGAAVIPLGIIIEVMKRLAVSPAASVVVLPLVLVSCFFLMRRLIAGSVKNDRKLLAGVLESIADLSAEHAVRPRTRIADAPEEEAEEQAEEEAAAEAEA